MLSHFADCLFTKVQVFDLQSCKLQASDIKNTLVVFLNGYSYVVDRCLPEFDGSCVETGARVSSWMEPNLSPLLFRVHPLP